MCVDVCWLIPAVRQLRPMAFRMSDEHLYNATQLCAKGVDECTRVCVCVLSGALSKFKATRAHGRAPHTTRYVELSVYVQRRPHLVSALCWLAHTQTHSI